MCSHSDIVLVIYVAVDGVGEILALQSVPVAPALPDLAQPDHGGGHPAVPPAVMFLIGGADNESVDSREGVVPLISSQG